MPCSVYIRRQGPDFIKKYPHALSAIATEWLSYLEIRDGISIVNSRSASEHRSGPRKISVDGFCESTNTVYQFQGCWYHGEDFQIARI